MIKNGNYKFLNFEKNKEKFVDAFSEYFGRENEETIRERINETKYIPYMNYEYIVEYYYAKMKEYRDEIFENYSRISGRKLTDKMKDLLFKDGSSPMFNATSEGYNLNSCFYSPEAQSQLRKLRKEIGKEFKMNGKFPISQIRKEARNLSKALIEVEKAHPCDVFKDFRRAIDNRRIATQMFITNINKKCPIITDRDFELLSKPDFDSFERENLDCKHLLFGNNISEPGLMSYFTSEKDYQLTNGTLDEQIKVLFGRVMYFDINNEEEKLQFLTRKELYRTDKRTEEEKIAFANSLLQEYAYQDGVATYYVPLPNEADDIERTRMFFSQTVNDGCKFSGRLNALYGECSQHDSQADLHWVTYLDFKDGRLDTPDNYIFFDEDQTYNSEELVESLIHEIGHALSRQNFVFKDKESGFSKTGINMTYEGVEDGEYMGGAKLKYPGLMQVEEDFNNRIAREVAEIFINKYGALFESCDIEELEDERPFNCMYDYYNFMTEKVWQRYKDEIKQQRLEGDSSLYYDIDKIPPITKFESNFEYMKYRALRRLNPDKLTKRGTISFALMTQLASLINEFREYYEHEFGEYCYNENIDADMLHTQDFSLLPNIDVETIAKLTAFKQVSDTIYNRMIAEEEKIKKNQAFINRLKGRSKKIASNKYWLKDSQPDEELISHILSKVESKEDITDNESVSTNIVDSVNEDELDKKNEGSTDFDNSCNGR